MKHRLVALWIGILILIVSLVYKGNILSAQTMIPGNINVVSSGQRLSGEGVTVDLPIAYAASMQVITANIMMNENFEGVWPSSSWKLEDHSNADGGEYLWGKGNCNPHTGSFVGWAVGGGAQGSTHSCTNNYPNNIDSWAIYGPFDLSNATSASLLFHFWGVTEISDKCTSDQLYVTSSTDGKKFSGQYFCGDWRQGNAGNSYYQYSLDLNKRLGQSQVWVGIAFKSNDTVTDIGMAIDDITLDVVTNTILTPISTSSISGRITDNTGAGITDVTITAAGPTIKAVTTDNNGDYTLSGLTVGNYELTPFKNGYTFSPPLLPVSVSSDITGKNFTGILSTDLLILDVKPVQAVEGAQLVVGKSTAVRVRIGVAGFGATNVRIKISYNNNDSNIFYPHTDDNLYPGGSFKQSTTVINIPPYIPTLDVYFFPPSTFWPKTTDTYRITAVVESDGDTNPTNNQKTVEQSVVRTTWGGDDDLRLFIGGIEDYNNYVIGDSITFVQRTFPVGDLNVKTTHASTNVSLSAVDEAYCGLSAWGAAYQYCRTAMYAKQLWKMAKIADPAMDRVVGITPPNRLEEMLGKKGTRGVTPVDPLTGQAVFGAIILDSNAAPHALAHELGHTYGLYLPPSSCEEYDPDCNPNTPLIPGVTVVGGVNSFGRSIKQDGLKVGNVTSHVYDFMGDDRYKLPEFDRWVTLDTYRQLIHPVTELATIHDAGFVGVSETTQPVIMIGGMVKATGEFILDSYYLLPDGVPSNLPTQGDILIQLQGNNSEILYQGALPSSIAFLDADLPSIDAAPIAVFVPFNVNTHYVVISRSGQEISRRVVSANPPSIAILSPQPNQVVDQLINVNWQVSDPDQDPVRVSILLSSDGGQTWQAVAMDVEGTSYNVNTSLLQPGDSYWVKLIATDGVLTSAAINGSFKVLARLYMPLAVANGKPTVQTICGQYIRLTQSIDKWPAFLPSGSNEPWIIDPFLSNIFQEGTYARIGNPKFGNDLGPTAGYLSAKYLLGYYSITPVSSCGLDNNPPTTTPIPPTSTPPPLIATNTSVPPPATQTATPSINLQPILTTPTDGEIVTSRTLVFTWSEVSNAANYQINVRSDPNIGELGGFLWATIATTRYDGDLSSVNPVFIGATFYWSVRVQQTNGAWGNWATPSTFIYNPSLPTTAAATPTNTPISTFTPIPPTATSTATPSSFFYVLTNDGIVKFSETGEQQRLINNLGDDLQLLNDELYLIDDGRVHVFVYDLMGNFRRIIPIPSSISGKFLQLTILPDGRLVFMDNQNDKIYFANSSGSLLSTVNIREQPDSLLQNLYGVVVGNHLIVSEDGSKRLIQIDVNTYQKSLFRDLSSLPDTWLGAIIFANGTYYICGPQTVYQFTEGSDVTQVAQLPNDIYNITGIRIVDDFAFVSVNFAGEIQKIDLNNRIPTVLISGLNSPRALQAAQ